MTALEMTRLLFENQLLKRQVDNLQRELEKARGINPCAIDHEHEISWNVSCRNCADYLDASYEQYALNEKAQNMISLLLKMSDITKNGISEILARAHEAALKIVEEP